ncbi:hypothetical protein J605_0750 [Acinetobacter baumannii 1412924]|uniref:hypothetical protein n=1 Tax=Acinetobacter baumannii TaxID=470 RepID=UPI00044F0CD2|nr:hypothetical protein [Acinetobacter baumannii]EXH50688.1 hypothetical protein J605_0750 [Acinetobacter baumannii 1412924]
MSEFEEYYKNSEWFGTYESDLMMKEAFEAGQQSQQAKVEELQNDVSIMLASHKRMSVGLLQQQDKIEKLIKERDELQKRVNSLEQILNKATEVVDLNIETVEQSRDKAKDMQSRNYSASMLYFLKPIRRVLEQALKGEG